MQRLLLIVAVAVVAAAGGYFAAMKLAGPAATPAPVTGPPPAAPAELIGERRPDFAHRDPAGRIWSAADFDGTPVLLNFWATWCAPCVEEMPMLSGLQRAHAGRLQVVGIALDDAERAAAFARDLDLAYPVLVGETDVVITGQRYGNRSGMLPFTVLVDAQGTVRWAHLGALDAAEVASQIAALD